MTVKHADACLFTIYSGGRPWRTHKASAVFFDDDRMRGTRSRAEPTFAVSVVDRETGEVIRYPGWSQFEVANG